MSEEKVNIEEEKVNIDFKCDKCYKTFKYKRSLEKHACKGILTPTQCSRCMKIFACKQSKYVHMKTCTVSHVCSTSTCAQEPVCINNHYTINNGTVNNVIINLRSYGNENMEHITNEVKDSLIKEINGAGIAHLIKQIHFNPELPENHNIRKHDKSRWKIYDNNQWELISFKTAIDDLIKRYRHVLSERIASDDFEQKLNCQTTLHSIIMNYYKFGSEGTPADFYRCVRSICDYMENLENRYKEKQYVMLMTN